jgi:hypothetical protein
MAADQAISFAGRFDGMQTSNISAKTDKLLVKTVLIDSAAQQSYALASIQPGAELERPANPAVAATPAVTTAAIALSASVPRPSASRHSDRYCSIDLRSATALAASAGRKSFSTARASS